MLKMVNYKVYWRIPFSLKFIDICTHGCFYCCRVPSLDPLYSLSPLNHFDHLTHPFHAISLPVPSCIRVCTEVPIVESEINKNINQHLACQLIPWAQCLRSLCRGREKPAMEICTQCGAHSSKAHS